MQTLRPAKEMWEEERHHIIRQQCSPKVRFLNHHHSVHSLQPGGFHLLHTSPDRYIDSVVPVLPTVILASRQSLRGDAFRAIPGIKI